LKLEKVEKQMYWQTKSCRTQHTKFVFELRSFRRLALMPVRVFVAKCVRRRLRIVWVRCMLSAYTKQAPFFDDVSHIADHTL